jgi:hypothetical protein
MESGKNTILSGLAVGFLAGIWLMGCSSAPIKMECSETQARIDYGDLTGDQLRFAMQELEDCRQRARKADERDSSLIDGAEQRFTPSDSL